VKKTGSWSLRAGMLIVTGVLTAGCTLGGRAAAPAPKAPAGVEPAATVSGVAPPASAPTAAAPAGTGSGQPTSPGSTTAPLVPPAGSGTSYISTQDQQALTQDQATLDQGLTQMQNELATSDQATSGGENDVPSN
jgi:hypothetical protein